MFFVMIMFIHICNISQMLYMLYIWPTHRLLEDFYVYENQLTGSLPMVFENVENLGLYNNMFTGPLVVQSEQVILLQVSHNMFTGSFPSILCSSSSIIEITLSYNQFTGEIPSCIGSIINSMTFLGVSNNLLSGTIPSSVTNTTSLKTVILSTNYFDGSITNLCNNMQSLSTIDVSDNGFTGQLPYGAFQPLLVSFVGAKNCFIGPLSGDICDALYLDTLILSGLNAGSSCAKSISLFGDRVRSSTPFEGWCSLWVFFCVVVIYVWLPL